MNSQNNIREIPAFSTYPVRQPVLRPGRPLSECVFQGDEDESTFHLGVFHEEQLAGVASYMQATNPLFPNPHQFQLRGMAILPEFKNQGFGAALLNEGEKRLLIKKASPLLWFNAREYAVGFYKKYGYQTIGEKFDIPGVCAHIVMYKQL